jgi:hypothetical protein
MFLAVDYLRVRLRRFSGRVEGAPSVGRAD